MRVFNGNGSWFKVQIEPEVQNVRGSTLLDMSDTRGLRHRILFSLRRRHIIHIDLHRCSLLNESDSQH